MREPSPFQQGITSPNRGIFSGVSIPQLRDYRLTPRCHATILSRSTLVMNGSSQSSSSTEVLMLIGELTRKMADLGLGLYAAHSLISGAAED